ncbi:MAG TPA: hypothetical protein ENG33_03575 [Chloroflexi bacterium]|nr:hypothetical protein [Chloroflexota bacterium]
MKGNWGKIIPLLMLILLTLPMSGCAKVVSANPVAQFTGDEAFGELKTLRREVQLLNLINGLELTQEQMEFILEKAKEAQALREEHLSQNQEEINQTIEILTELKEALMQGENIPEELKQRFREIEGQNREKQREYEEQINGIAEEIKGILEDHQLYALKEYVPCVIPPETGTRIGQAKGSTPGEQLLWRMRRMPYSRFQEFKERIAEKMLEKLKRHLPPGSQLDEEAEKERLVKLLEEAYTLSDVDFNLKKDELLEEIMKPYELPKPPDSLLRKIRIHLLDPHIIPLLEEKLGK